MPRMTDDTLRQRARAIRADCPTCRTLRRGALPCEACVRRVCDLLRQRWAEAQAAQRDPTKRESA